MNDVAAARQARLFKALMHPVRLQILDALRGGEQCVCHLEAHLDKPQAYISQQLAVLRRSGIVVDERDGPNIYYRIAHPEVLALLNTARTMADGDACGTSPAPVACPCPRCALPQRPALEPLPLLS